MYLALILVFFASLAAILIMLGWRIRRLRSGKSKEAENQEFSLGTKAVQLTPIIHEFFRRLPGLAKKAVENAARVSLKIWRKIQLEAKNRIKHRFPKTAGALNGDNGNKIETGSGGPSSYFLRKIREYKSKIKKQI